MSSQRIGGMLRLAATDPFGCKTVMPWRPAGKT
jgi:hypothetical protein